MGNETTEQALRPAERGQMRLDQSIRFDRQSRNVEIGMDGTERTCFRVALLTGGGDKPYALGLATALAASGLQIDFIGSDDLEVPELLSNSSVNFLNLRGDQRTDAALMSKMWRVMAYYWRLIRYAAVAQPRIFHILWNNKFKVVDRVVLMLYYRLLGKKVLLTAHNVNAAKRDASDSLGNRISLRIQYQLSDHIFVHTDSMKAELVSEFGLRESKVSVVPFGINNTVPNTALSRTVARQRLGIKEGEKTLLFFGNIAPYKGLEYLVRAFRIVSAVDPKYCLVIAGRPKGPRTYWKEVEREILNAGQHGRVVQEIEYIPDCDTEVYFKAADVLVLPYVSIFQSGVLLLGYNFGLPAIATDVGSLKQDLVEGEAGFICRPRDPEDLSKAIERFFASELYRKSEAVRQEIRSFASQRYSWSEVARITKEAYASV